MCGCAQLKSLKKASSLKAKKAGVSKKKGSKKVADGTVKKKKKRTSKKKKGSKKKGARACLPPAECSKEPTNDNLVRPVGCLRCIAFL